MIHTERLSILAQQLRLEKDREKYKKVIGMKHSIESRLEGIYLQKFNTVSHPLIKQPSMWHLHDNPPSFLKPTHHSLAYLLKQLENPMQYSEPNHIQDETEDEDDFLDALPSIVHKAVRTDASIVQLITPPTSPQSKDSFHTLPPLVHLQKKIPSLKGFLKRNHKLGPYELIRSEPVIFLPPCDGEWIKALESTKKPKLMLRLTLALPDDSTPNDQRRYGFTFQKIPRHDHVKLALVPDSLVKEALGHWIEKGKHSLPSLTKADKIVRSKKKIYIVYDLVLLQTV